MLKASKIGSLSNEKNKISFHRKKEGRRPKVCSHFMSFPRKAHASIELATLSKEQKRPLCPPKGSKNCGKFPSKSARNRGKFQSSWGPILHLLDPFFVKDPHLHVHSLGNRDETRDLGNPWSTFWIPMGYKRRRLWWLVAPFFFLKTNESLLGDWFWTAIFF